MRETGRTFAGAPRFFRSGDFEKKGTNMRNTRHSVFACLPAPTVRPTAGPPNPAQASTPQGQDPAADGYTADETLYAANAVAIARVRLRLAKAGREYNAAQLELGELQKTEKALATKLGL